MNELRRFVLAVVLAAMAPVLVLGCAEDASEPEAFESAGTTIGVTPEEVRRARGELALGRASAETAVDLSEANALGADLTTELRNNVAAIDELDVSAAAIERLVTSGTSTRGLPSSGAGAGAGSLGTSVSAYNEALANLEKKLKATSAALAATTSATKRAELSRLREVLVSMIEQLKRAHQKTTLPAGGSR